MTNYEKKAINFIDDNKFIFLGIAVTILAVSIRICGLDTISRDAATFLLPWFKEIKHQGGLLSLGKQVGDYNIPYQTIIAIMTYLPFKPLYMYKVVSICFDFALAISSGLLVLEMKQKKSLKLFVFAYSAVLMLPTVIWNSAYWGQCDSIFVTFTVLAVLFLHKDKFIISFIFLGLAFSFKLQTIFVVPFYIYVYLIKKNYSIFNFLITPIVMYIMCIPGLVFGRNFTAPFEIYGSQTDTYHNMQMNFMNIWAIIGGNRYDILKDFASMLTIFALGIGLVWLMSKKIDLDKKDLFLTILIWTIWTCVMFLPSMHDRYGYMLDILLVISVFKNKKIVFFAAISVVASMLVYSPVIFGNRLDPFNINISIWYLGAYLFYTYKLIKDVDSVDYNYRLENESYKSDFQAKAK